MEDIAGSGTKVSPLLYRVFFEEINRAGDGGLDAEMIQNRSFEDAAAPIGWTLLNRPDDDAKMALDSPAEREQPSRRSTPTLPKPKYRNDRQSLL